MGVAASKNEFYDGRWLRASLLWGYYADAKLHPIRYEDGDEEELDEGELAKWSVWATATRMGTERRGTEKNEKVEPKQSRQKGNSATPEHTGSRRVPLSKLPIKSLVLLCVAISTRCSSLGAFESRQLSAGKVLKFHYLEKPL